METDEDRLVRITGNGGKLTKLDREFLEFHEHNPDIYDIVVKLARQARRIRGGKLGIGMLWEVVRWEIFIETTGDYKMNNNYRSRYARLIMDKEKDLSDAFDVRVLKA